MAIPTFPLGCGCRTPLLGRRAALALAAGVVGGGVGVLAPPAHAQGVAASRPTSPAAAMRRLMRGNNRYATNNVETLDEDATILRQGTVSQQPVFAAVLSCTDLKQPVDLIFDQPIGEVHTVKTPGNVVTPDVLATLEYAVSGQGAVAVLVLAHSGCATIAAAIKARPEFGKPGPYAALARAVFEGRGDPVITARINALVQAATLFETSKVIARRVAGNQITLVGSYFDAATGRVATAA